ncbi:hypothetical protein DITRI_Ditri04bG0188500 [Diplodiscus trichospermus]
MGFWGNFRPWIINRGLDFSVSVGHKSPIILCSLLPNHNENFALDLKFDEDDDLVSFSVSGPPSIHPSEYFVSDDGDHLQDE